MICLNTVRFEKSDDRSFVKFLIADNSIVTNKRHTFVAEAINRQIEALRHSADDKIQGR